MLCTRCGEFPQSTRKGVQKGLCCNRCPNHGPWCSSKQSPKENTCRHQPKPTPPKQAVPISAAGTKREVEDDVVESSSPQRPMAQPKKRCKLTCQLRSIIKSMRDTQCVPKSFCTSLCAKLNDRCTILSGDFGPLEQKAFGSYQQMKAFRILNETLNSVETKKAEEVQKAESLASQAAQELRQFEEAASTAEAQAQETTQDVQAKRSELAECDSVISKLGEQIAVLESQEATSGDASAELHDAKAKLAAATARRQTCAEALARAEFVQSARLQDLETKLEKLTALRSVAEDVMQAPIAARQQLEDFQRGPHASFLEIATELVMLHGSGILGDDAIGGQSSPVARKQSLESDHGVSGEQQEVQNLGGA